jgi:hypothetical protein
MEIEHTGEVVRIRDGNQYLVNCPWEKLLEVVHVMIEEIADEVFLETD